MRLFNRGRVECFPPKGPLWDRSRKLRQVWLVGLEVIMHDLPLEYLLCNPALHSSIWVGHHYSTGNTLICTKEALSISSLRVWNLSQESSSVGDSADDKADTDPSFCARYSSKLLTRISSSSPYNHHPRRWYYDYPYFMDEELEALGKQLD